MVATGVAAKPRGFAETRILPYNKHPAFQVPRLWRQSDLSVQRHCGWIV